MATHSCPAEARRRARQAPRRPAPDPGPRHLRRRREDRRACSTWRSSAATSRTAGSRSIDTSAAEAMEGVEAVFTGAQIAELLDADADRHAVPLARRIAPSRSMSSATRAKPVAVVVASDRYVARDAADAIVVDIRRAAGRGRSRAGDDRASPPSSTRSLRTTSPSAPVPERHRRRARRQGGRHGHREGVQTPRSSSRSA